jgi:hypothetical protein
VQSNMEVLGFWKETHSGLRRGDWGNESLHERRCYEIEYRQAD